ncbi:Predicted PurR-regulated permease PerM [Natronoarchaeum philippinense]|uniref:Predicted PurR-regulated permease PerM n=1 Tax=Natronoarchaeum philippinense TaxID=558529 RepID=A0A285P7H5_NATPI|nr:AI-2E family transporter [Natronoarchaeum philippinense]SNZ16086.1 Predicted PurR-regulated permease PerM [Natronoarchaeum philippinense]
MGTRGGNSAERLLWTMIGVVLAAFVGVALRSYVGALVSAIFLYYATRPIYRRIEARTAHPTLAVVLTLLALVVPMLIVIGYGLALLVQELDSVLSGGALSTLQPYVQPYLDLIQRGELRQLRQTVSQAGGVPGSAGSAAGSVLSRLVAAIGAVFAVLTRVALMLILLFYLLRDGHKLRSWFVSAVEYDDRIVSFVDGVDADLETVFFNNLAFIVFTAVQASLIYLGFNLLAPGSAVVGTPVLLGALIGIGTLVPVVGMKLVYLPYAAYLGAAAVVGSTPAWHPIAFLAVSGVVVDTIPDIVIRPYLSGRNTLHIGLVMLGYFLGALTFGWWGLFFGPIVVVAAVHFAEDIFPWLVGEYL